MVAVINTGHSIRRIFYYNENKVSLGDAVCIGEGNYPIDIDKMSSVFKLNLLLKQLELNENVTRNSVHISLNFDLSEKDLSKEKLMEITALYMSKIGFGTQPYLVYQHYDAGHPHIHILSIKVKPDGRRIDMQNIGKNESETARKEIENIFGLVKAQDKKIPEKLLFEPIATMKIQYGKMESKKAMAAVLYLVINHYKFVSLAELNAVLTQYNLQALRGSEQSRIFKNNGLLFSILDKNGKPNGVPVKASDFYFKPTLKFLNEKFIINKTEKEPYKKQLRNTIDLLFLKNAPKSITEFISHLEKEGLNTVLRTSPQGEIYGVTFVDHRSKSVFNGSTLGREYTAKSIIVRCALNCNQIENPLPINYQNQHLKEDTRPLAAIIENYANTVMLSNQNSDFIPFQFKKKFKKKKRRKL